MIVTKVDNSTSQWRTLLLFVLFMGLLLTMAAVLSFAIAIGFGVKHFYSIYAEIVMMVLATTLLAVWLRLQYYKQQASDLSFLLSELSDHGDLDSIANTALTKARTALERDIDQDAEIRKRTGGVEGYSYHVDLQQSHFWRLMKLCEQYEVKGLEEVKPKAE